MKPKRIAIFLFYLLAMSYGTNANAQNTDASIYGLFDKTAGIKNLGINNGTIHNNIYRSIDDTHRYYGANKYLIGDVFYDGQPYSGMYLKYDLLENVPIVKLEGENNNMGFNLIAEKTEYFYIDNKKFTNLSLKKAPGFEGFYEETALGKLALYTKHYKDRIEVLTNKGVFNKYYEKNDFVLNYQNGWYKINSEKDVTGLFPGHKSEIADFYTKNASLERSDKKQFMKNLAKFLNDFLINELAK